MPVSIQPLTTESGFRSPGFLVDGNGNATVRTITVTSAGDGGGGGTGIIGVFDNIIVAGEKLIEDGDSSVSLGNGITGSYLTQVGVLQSLEIEGDLTVSEGSTPYLRIENGSITLNSFGASPGSINNINIGDVTPKSGNFTFVGVEDAGILEPTFRGEFSLLTAYDINQTVRYQDELYRCILESLGNLPTNEDYFETYNGRNLLTVDGDMTVKGLVATGPGKIDNIIIGTDNPARAVFTNVEIVDAPTSSNQATRKDYVDNKISAFAIVFGA
jgi:hypothetical protein